MTEEDVNQILWAAIEAGDYQEASLALLGHAFSRELQRESVNRLVDFALHGEIPNQLDKAMIRMFAEVATC